MQSFQISADSLNPMKKQKIFRILRIKPLMNGEKYNAIPETYFKPGIFSGNRSCIPGLQPGSVEKKADDSDNQWNSEHVDNR